MFQTLSGIVAALTLTLSLFASSDRSRDLPPPIPSMVGVNVDRIAEASESAFLLRASSVVEARTVCSICEAEFSVDNGWDPAVLMNPANNYADVINNTTPWFRYEVRLDQGDDVGDCEWGTGNPAPCKPATDCGGVVTVVIYPSSALFSIDLPDGTTWRPSPDELHYEGEWDVYQSCGNAVSLTFKGEFSYPLSDQVVNIELECEQCQTGIQ